MATPHNKRRDAVPIWLAAFFVGSLALTVLLPILRPTVADRMRKSDPKIRQAIFDLVQPVALSNCRLERFGEPHDGGYLMCANLLDGVAAGYSYGISGYDGWGCQISARLQVPVHQYRLLRHDAAQLPRRKDGLSCGVRCRGRQNRGRTALRYHAEPVCEKWSRRQIASRQDGRRGRRMGLTPERAGCYASSHRSVGDRVSLRQ